MEASAFAAHMHSLNNCCSYHTLQNWRMLSMLYQEHPDVMLQALTSSELRSRLSKQGKRFQQQLTERGALHHLMTAVQSGDSDAKLQLFGITKVRIRRNQKKKRQEDAFQRS